MRTKAKETKVVVVVVAKNKTLTHNIFYYNCTIVEEEKNTHTHSERILRKTI